MTERGWSLVHEAVLAALTYEHPVVTTPDSESVTAWVWRRFVNTFDQHLYVERPKPTDEILKALGDRYLVALVGERGAGKSTLLRYISRLLPHSDHPAFSSLIDHRDPSHEELVAAHSLTTKSICYIDLLDEGVGFDTKTATEDDVFALIRDRLIDEMVTNSVYAHITGRWRRYQLEHGSAYRELRVLHANERAHADAGAQFPDLVSFSRVPTARACVRECDRSFRAPDTARVAIQDFCKFLQSALAHQVIIFVDNADHLDPAPQEHLVDALSLIARSARGGAACCLAIRKGNWRSITAKIDPIQHPRAIMLSPYDTTGHEAWRRPDERLTPATLVGDLIRLRLDRLAIELEQDPSNPIVRGAAGVDVPSLVRSIRAVAESLLTPTGTRNESRISELTRWHNGSLRHIALTTSRLALDAISDGNPGSPYAQLEVDHEIQEDEINWTGPEALLIDTHLYRKFFLIGRSPTTGKAAENRYSSDDYPIKLPFIQLRGALNNRQDIVFVKHRILQYLSNHDGESTLDDIEAAFAAVNVSRTVLVGKLIELAGERSEADTGLVSINGRNRDLNQLTAVGTSRVHLNDAGDFFFERYSKLPDYLFWAASRNSEAWDCFTESAEDLGTAVGAGAPVPFALLADCEFRLLVAARYLAVHILPLAEWEMPTASHPSNPNVPAATDRLNRVLEQFGRRKVYVRRAYDTAQDFAETLVSIGRCRQEIREAVDGHLDPVRSYCAHLDRRLRS